jgi:hypothetical protein
VVVFNATTAKWDSDRNCVLTPNDHSSITRESVISYERGRIYTKDEQDRLEQSAPFSGMRRATASPALVRRIQQGAITSDQTALEIKDIMRDEIAQTPSSGAGGQKIKK